LPNNLCSYLRYSLNLILKGEINDYDGVIITHSCDGARRFYDVVKKYLKVDSYFLDIPRNNNKLGQGYFFLELKKFKSYLEEMSGSIITDESLSESIKIYNKSRKLLEKIYNLRGKFPNLLNSKIMERISRENSTKPKNLINVILNSIIKEVEETDGKHFNRQNCKRIFVSGNLIDTLPIFEFIEVCNGYVVGDDLCFGGRYYPLLVDEDKDPILALSERYINAIPCGRMLNFRERFDYIIDSIKRYRADGLIYGGLKFCDNFLIDYSELRNRLEKENIPSLFLESEFFSLGKGQIKTRIEGFLEIL